MFLDEILDNIEVTIDKLIENTIAAKDSELSIEEKDSYKKIQEILLAHFFFMDEKLKEKKESLKKINNKNFRSSIQDKLNKFYFLNNRDKKKDLIK
ncbi:MAG: hypothetical protein K1060chlam5_00636 [Candidatus Anoxychlamydiales bacterium]|nr:hypothetical protein [Candidatus Anoxychlamydiales bacterium]